MVDFHAEGSRRAALSFNVSDRTESPLEHEAGGMLHRVWLWLTTGAGLIATAVGISMIVSIALAGAFVSGLLYRDHAEEVRVILQRVFDLTALQAGSQSALGCLDVSRRTRSRKSANGRFLPTRRPSRVPMPLWLRDFRFSERRFLTQARCVHPRREPSCPCVKLWKMIRLGSSRTSLRRDMAAPPRNVPRSRCSPIPAKWRRISTREPTRILFRAMRLVGKRKARQQSRPYQARALQRPRFLLYWVRALRWLLRS